MESKKLPLLGRETWWFNGVQTFPVLNNSESPWISNGRQQCAYRLDCLFNLIKSFAGYSKESVNIIKNWYELSPYYFFILFLMMHFEEKTLAYLIFKLVLIIINFVS